MINIDDRTLWRVHVKKRKGGPSYYGQTFNDGLQSLFHILCDDGTTRIASVLDQITWLEALPLADLPKSSTRKVDTAR